MLGLGLLLARPTAAAAPPPPPEPGYREVGASVTGASELRPLSSGAASLTFDSSDPGLATGFQWAKRQALAMAFDDDPVGPWYEAAEPGREAFCMRDTAHQAMGAHALGLAKHNLNMLRRFAENVSDARDWCSLWEIDRYNRPAPVDYRNDAEFWYNLPANFDILDAAYRMHLWTGELAYVQEPAFLNYYERTVRDYVERWGLGPDQVMKRPRLLNVRGVPDPKKKFQVNRGIPGYDEQDHDYVLGIDVLATQYAGYLAYARLQEIRGREEPAREYIQKALAVRALVNGAWWNEAGGHFYGRLDKDHTLTGKAGTGLLYRDVVDDGPKVEAALREGRGSVEVQYRYGDPDAATAQMLEIAHGGRSRREYPEVPYSWVGALVNGTMGVTLEARSALESQTEGFWVAAVIRTLSGLGSKVAWAELRGLPIRGGVVAVRHEGARKTTFTNENGPAVLWRAAFRGTHENLLVNGRPLKARAETDASGSPLSTVRITVGGGGTTTVQVP